MPGKVAVEVLPQQRDLDLLLDVPVVGQRRRAVEHELAGGPDIDEVGWDAEPGRIVDPPMREPGDREIDRVDGEQHEAGVEHSESAFSLRSCGTNTLCRMAKSMSPPPRR